MVYVNIFLSMVCEIFFYLWWKYFFIYGVWNIFLSCVKIFFVVWKYFLSCDENIFCRVMKIFFVVWKYFLSCENIFCRASEWVSEWVCDENIFCVSDENIFWPELSLQSLVWVGLWMEWGCAVYIYIYIYTMVCEWYKYFLSMGYENIFCRWCVMKIFFVVWNIFLCRVKIFFVVWNIFLSCVKIFFVCDENIFCVWVKFFLSMVCEIFFVSCVIKIFFICDENIFLSMVCVERVPTERVPTWARPN